MNRGPAVWVAFAAIVMILGSGIPLPGLDWAVVSNQLAASTGRGAMERLSIMALGILPLLSFLILFEVAKLLVPRLAAWTESSPRAAGSIPFIIAALALGAAIFQAYGLTRAFEAMGLPAANADNFVLVGTASLVGGFAVLLWLAYRIKLATLAFAGFWVILVLPDLPSYGTAIGRWIEAARVGMVSSQAFAILPAMLVVGTAAIVFVARSLRRAVARAGGDALVWSPILVWPPFVSAGIAHIVAITYQEFVSSPAMPNLEDYLTAWMIALALTIPVVVFLYARTIALAFPHSAEWYGKRAILTALALLQVAICVGFELASQRWVIFLNGASFIALIVVFWAVWEAMRAAPWRTSAGREER